MSCQNCGSDSINPCSCSNGFNAFTVSTTNVTIANPMTIPVSNTGQYTGVWARPEQIVFIQGYGYYEVTASTATSITVAYPASPFVAGATFNPNTVDYSNSGTIISGSKISPAGIKGITGTSGVAAIIEEIGYSTANTVSTLAFGNLLAAVVVIPVTQTTDGDSVIIKSKFFFDYNSGTDGASVKILANAVTLTTTPFGTNLNLDAKLPYMEVVVTLTRTSVSAANADIDVAFGDYGFDINSYTNEFVNGAPFFNLKYKNLALAVDWTSAVNINIQGNVGAVTNTIKLGFYSVENFQQI